MTTSISQSLGDFPHRKNLFLRQQPTEPYDGPSFMIFRKSLDKETSTSTLAERYLNFDILPSFVASLTVLLRLVSKYEVNLWDIKFNVVLMHFGSRCKVSNLSIGHIKFQIISIKILVKLLTYLNIEMISTWNFHHLFFPTRGNYRRQHFD